MRNFWSQWKNILALAALITTVTIGLGLALERAEENKTECEQAGGSWERHGVPGKGGHWECEGL